MTDPHVREAARIVEAASNARPAVIRSFFDGGTFTVTHVISDPATAKAAVIDSVLDFDPASGRTSFASADKVIEYIQSEGLEIEWLLETHVHADHLSAAPYFQEKLGGKLAIGRHILTVQEVFGKIFNESARFARDGSQFDHLFDDGDRFTVGSIEAIALHVPGHTPADMTYVIGDAVRRTEKLTPCRIRELTPSAEEGKTDDDCDHRVSCTDIGCAGRGDASTRRGGRDGAVA